MTFSLDHDWRRFVEEHWERKPAVLENPFGGTIATADEMLRAMVRLRTRTWRNGSPQRHLLRFFVEKGQILCDAQHYLPGEDDSSFAQYVARVTGQLDGRNFGLSGNAMQAGDRTLAKRMRGILRGLFDVVGMPSEEAEAVCFAGNYQISPFGIHTDTAGVLSFVISGKKRYRVWPYEAIENVPELRYGSIGWERHAESSVLLEGGPGDVMYWPSTYWHVGIAEPGELSVVLNVPMYLSKTPWGFASKAMSRVMRQRPAARDLLTFEPTQGYPEVLEAAMHDMATSHPEFALEARRHWLEMVTCASLPAYDERAPRPALTDEMVVETIGGEDVMLAEPHAEWFVVAYAGDSIAVPRTPGVEAAFRDVRAPGRRRVAEVGTGDARSLLAELVTIGALRVVA